jgi:hypothetical protein
MLRQLIDRRANAKNGIAQKPLLKLFIMRDCYAHVLRPPPLGVDAAQPKARLKKRAHAAILGTDQRFEVGRVH